MRVAIPFLALVFVACSGGDTGGDGPFTLTVTIPASYTTFHGGMDFSIALVAEDNSVEDRVDDALPASGSFDVDLVTATADDFDIAFWVDANVGGGTAGTCDGSPDYFDHMWSYQAGTVSADRTLELPAHNTDFQDVCDIFAAAR